ncbi:MAG: BamA/TamA family outer membrane protein, partial [Gemmatimonadaceae bacterium]
GVTIDVVTFDEVSLVLDGKVSSKTPMVRGVRLGENNLSGSAVAVTGAWQDNSFFRDTYNGKFVDYQFLGRPYKFSLQGSRNELGGSWDALVSHPFLTDLQRTSWRASAGSWSGYIHFKRPKLKAPSLYFTREYSDVGGVRAFGRVGHIFLLGGTVSRERERTGHDPVVIFDSAVVRDTTSALIGRYSEHRTSRVNLLLGFRRLTYMQVHSFDAVDGTQDVRTGVQLATLLGRGMKMSDQDERDYFMSTDLYFGHGTPTSFTGLEFMGERRRDMDTHTSDGVLASGRAAWYAHPAHKHTSIIDAEFSGGWNQRVPFQLRMADREGGLRGYGSSDLGGARRMVVRMEDRYMFGHVRQLAAVGTALWVDAGRLWAGDAPFGVNTNIKYSAGIGLLAALPPRSRRTWRVDLAFPLNDRGDAKFEIRFTNHDFTRWFWREPGDVQAVRERAIPNSVYNWP